MPDMGNEAQANDQIELGNRTVAVEIKDVRLNELHTAPGFVGFQLLLRVAEHVRRDVNHGRTGKISRTQDRAGNLSCARGTVE